MLGLVAFPAIDPVLVSVGPFAIRWYALAYIVGIVSGWMIMRRLGPAPPPVATREQVDDFLTWTVLGIILGGRLGYVLFYRPGHYLANPLEALMVWQGGMSFPGEGGDMRLPGEGRSSFASRARGPACGDRPQSERRRAPTAWRFVCINGFGGAHVVGIDRKSNGARPPTAWRLRLADRLEAAA